MTRETVDGSREETHTTNRPTRIVVFADFFKGYMSISTIVAAAIPIPVGSLKLIPAYSCQRGYLTVYSSLLCFLVLAFLFSIRHRLCTVMFGDRKGSGWLSAVPLLCILLTIGCIAGYHDVLQRSLDHFRLLGVTAKSVDLLQSADESEISYEWLLSILYLGIFVFAEIAFVLMALREHLQDVLCLDEQELLRGTPGLLEPVGKSAH
jgi:hypothetical protein